MPPVSGAPRGWLGFWARQVPSPQPGPQTVPLVPETRPLDTRTLRDTMCFLSDVPYMLRAHTPHTRSPIHTNTCPVTQTPPWLCTPSHTNTPAEHTLSLIHAYSHPHNTPLSYTLIQAQTSFHSVAGETLKSKANLLRERKDFSTLAKHLPALPYPRLTRARVSHSPSEGKWKTHIGLNAK